MAVISGWVRETTYSAGNLADLASLLGVDVLDHAKVVVACIC